MQIVAATARELSVKAIAGYVKISQRIRLTVDAVGALDRGPSTH